MIQRTSVLFSAVIVLLFLAGCAAPVQIMSPATESLTPYRSIEILPPQNDVVGQIDKSVVNSIMEDAVEGILDLKYFDNIIVSDEIGLKKELSDKVLRPGMLKDTTVNVALLKTTIAEYDEGSATLRFFFGSFAGSGQVTLELAVYKKTDKSQLIKAKTTAKISGAFSSADNVVGPLSKAIVNFTKDNFIAEKN